MNGDASIILGMTLHAVISAVLGLVFAVWASAAVRSPATIIAGGLVFGGLVYAVDFQILSRFIDQFSALLKATNQPFELTVHLVFGAVLGVLYTLAMTPPQQRTTTH